MVEHWNDINCRYKFYSKYYPANLPTAFPDNRVPNAINDLALGTSACACISPCVLVSHHPPPKKSPSPLFLFAPHKYYLHARASLLPPLPFPSFPSPPYLSPLSFPLSSLSPSFSYTRAPILTLGVRDKLLKRAFFFLHLLNPLLYSSYYWDSVLSDSSSKTSKEAIA